MEKPKGLHDPKEKLFIWKGGVICCLHWLKSPVVPRPVQAAGVALRTGNRPPPPTLGSWFTSVSGNGSDLLLCSTTTSWAVFTGDLTGGAEK